MQLEDYIQGNRRGKEANKLEREALNDPFIQNALDGFDMVTGDHVKIIKQLEKKYINPVVTHQSNRRVFLYGSVAASILLLIGFGTYLFWERNENNIPVIAMNQPRENESIIYVDSSESLPEQIEESQQKALVATKATNKIAPTPLSTILDMNESILSEKAENSESFMEEEPIKPTIHGKVVDEIGDPLIGVSILEKGTHNGTITDLNGTFTLQLSKDDSSKLVANYLGYESQEIIPSNKEEQTITLKPNNLAFSEVVVVGYGTQKKSVLTGAVAETKMERISQRNSDQSSFGEKEFQIYCQQKADKNVCDDGQGAIVKVSFFIDETGKPAKIEYKSFSCEKAVKEMESLLASSPAWTKTNRKVTMTIKW